MVNIQKGVAGRRIRRFFGSREQAETEAEEISRVAQSRGAEGLLETQGRGVTCEAAWETYLMTLRKRSDRHRKQAAMVGGVWNRAHGKKFVAAVRGADIMAWLQNWENPTTQGFYYRYMRAFFGWAWQIELVDRNPFERLKKPKEKASRPILTPDEMGDLLGLTMPDWLRNTLVLGGFAGLRTEEIVALTWDCFSPTQIHIRPGKDKVIEDGGWIERHVDIHDTCRRHLRPMASGRIVESHNWLRVRKTLFGHVLGGQWPANCLRHSFATYHLAMHGDPGKTAHQMGHTSPQMIYKTYARAASREQAAKWWAL